MLSVLIPVFNYDVQGLVNALTEQLTEVGKEYEIRVYDDLSTNKALKKGNESIAEIDNVVYKKLTKNLGFCRIRNVLAEEAKYDLLLFLDSDVEVIADDFIQKYLDLADGKTVFCGGMQYSNETPEAERFLKWKHGKSREEASAKLRNLNAHRTLWAGNFLIPKSIYLAVRFDDGSNNYGYNDTMFGYKMLVQDVPVVHIENVLLHKGLMPAEKFINRSMEAVENLLFFEKQEYIQPSFYSFIKVFKYYRILERLMLRRIYLGYFQWKKQMWIDNLKSPNPNLRNLDKLKLGKLVELKAS